MRKVILLLLIFGIIFGGVYGEYYSGTYEVDKKYQFQISNFPVDVDITIVDDGSGSYHVYADDSIYGSPVRIYSELKSKYLNNNENPNLADIIKAVERNYGSEVDDGYIQVIEFDNGEVITIQDGIYDDQNQDSILTYGDQKVVFTPCSDVPPFLCSPDINNDASVASLPIENIQSQSIEQRVEVTLQEISDLDSARAEAERYRQEQEEIKKNDNLINDELKKIEEDLKVPTLTTSQRTALESRKSELTSQLSENVKKREQLEAEKQRTEELALETQKKLELLKTQCETTGCSLSDKSKVISGLNKGLIESEKLEIENGKLLLRTKPIPGIPGKYYLEEVKTVNTIDNGYNTEEEISNLANNYASATDSKKKQIESYLTSNPGLETAKIAYLKATGTDLGINKDILNSFSTSFILSISEKNKGFAISALISKGEFETENVDTLKKIMNLGNPELSEIVILSAIAKDDDAQLLNNQNKETKNYKDKKTDNLASLCSGNLDCLNTVDTLPDENDLRTKFLQKMELGEIRYTEENFVEFLAQENNGLSPKDFQELVDAANTGNCKDSKWGKLICGWLDNIDATELQVKQFGEEIDDILDGIQIKGNVEIGYVNAMVSCAGDTENQCKSKIENECKRITSSQDEQDNCISLGNRALANSAIKNYEGVNEDILNKLFEDYNLCEGKSSTCRSDINSICGTDITSSACNDAIKDLCTDGSAACEAYEDLSRKMRKEGYTETSTAFDVIAALMNPDQNALAASELFGFESDYSDLPQWLTEDTASLICLAKIDGYLDTQVESQFEDGAGNTGSRGITQYGCSLEEGLEFDPNSGTYQPIVGQPCVEVLADLRGERTPILPNNQVQLTYSGYLKAPPNVNISYMLYVSYKIENQSEIELQPLFVHGNGSLDIKTVPAGEDISFYNVVRIPEVGTLKVPLGEEGVKLLLQSFYNDDGSTLEEYVSIITPVYPIEAGNYNDPLGQQSSSSGSSATIDDEIISQEEDSIDDGDIMENACQLIGAC